MGFRQTSKISKQRRGEGLFELFLRIPAMALILLLGAIAFFLYLGAEPAISHYKWSFIGKAIWDPVKQEFGALALVYGTLASSFLAILISAPLSIGISLFLNEIAPRSVARALGFLVEMLAAIPSVVYGLWGIFVLTPWLRATVEPFLAKTFGFLPFFQGAAYGVGMLAAGLILAIMITPTVTAICTEVFRSIPRIHREAALAIGATKWEMMKVAILKSAKSGISGAVMLGLGRALGETMAVTMVIGNQQTISASLFSPAQTMASIIANEYAEASERLHLAALIEVGLVLFLVTVVINSIARLFVWRTALRWSAK